LDQFELAEITLARLRARACLRLAGRVFGGDSVTACHGLSTARRAALLLPAGARGGRLLRWSRPGRRWPGEPALLRRRQPAARPGRASHSYRGALPGGWRHRRSRDGRRPGRDRGRRLPPHRRLRRACARGARPAGPARTGLGFFLRNLRRLREPRRASLGTKGVGTKLNLVGLAVFRNAARPLADLRNRGKITNALVTVAGGERSQELCG